MQDHIVKKIIESQETISTRKELQSFLGIINQVRNFIPYLSIYTISLTKKLKKNEQFEWTIKDDENIKKIKELVKKLPKLEFPDENKTYTWIVESDASKTHNAYGGVLKYRYTGEKQEHVCRYYSGTFKNNEANWEINRKELKAVKNNLLHFECYIVYSEFILRIDSKVVKDWLTGKLKDSITRKKINSIITDINVFSYKLELIKSTDNLFADYLSRNYTTVSGNKPRISKKDTVPHGGTNTCKKSVI